MEVNTIMEIRDCNCGNPENGFLCTCEHELRHPGDIQYICDICGSFTADRPICELCEAIEIDEVEEEIGVLTIINEYDDELPVTKLKAVLGSDAASEESYIINDDDVDIIDDPNYHDPDDFDDDDNIDDD